MSGPTTIIIAERDPGIRNALRVEFSRIDFVVLLAANGQEAEDFATRTVAHLAVLDVALPELSGYDACARIRRQNGYERTPLVLTAQARSPRIDAAAKRAGANAVLAKPYSFNDLLNALTAHLPADDPLLIKLPKGSGAMAGREWGEPETLEWSFGRDSGLSRNRLLLPVVRGQGIKIPLVRKP